MGSADLREAFAAEAGAGYSVEQGLLYYERDETGKEWQLLRFRGNGPSGPFEITSSKHSPNADPIEVARETAKELLKPTG